MEEAELSKMNRVKAVCCVFSLLLIFLGDGTCNIL